MDAAWWSPSSGRSATVSTQDPPPHVEVHGAQRGNAAKVGDRVAIVPSRPIQPAETVGRDARGGEGGAGLTPRACDPGAPAIGRRVQGGE